MAKRDPVRRIDYDAFVRQVPVMVQTVIVDQVTQPNVPVPVYAFTDLTPGGSEDTAIIDSAPLPTISEMIEIIGPVTGSGSSFEIVLPDIQEGDILVGWCVIDDRDAYIDSNTASFELDLYGIGCTVEPLSSNYYNPDGFAYYDFLGFPSTSDSGSSVSFDLKNTDSNGDPVSSTDAYAFWGCIVRKAQMTQPNIGDIYAISQYGSANFYATYHHLTSDNNYGTPTEMPWTDAAPIERDNQLVFFVLASHAAGGVTPSSGEIEMFDQSVGGSFLYVGAKLYNTSDGSDTGDHYFNVGSAVYYEAVSMSLFTYPGSTYP